MKARDAHQLRMARVWHYASAGLAMVAALSAFIGFAQWGFMREMFGSSGHGANVFIQVILGIFLAGGLACLALGALSMSVALNLKRLRHHRYNMIASLVTCAFVPFGTIAGILTVAVLNREDVQRAFGVTDSEGKGTQPPSGD